MRTSSHTWNAPQALRREAAAIGRYLVGSPPPEYVLERYVRAHSVLFRGEPLPSDRSLVLFVRRHPWALPFLDAALALFKPHSLLRNKILLVLALLETAPEFADLFFSDPLSKGCVVARIAGCGLRGVVSAMFGLVLYPFAVLAR